MPQPHQLPYWVLVANCPTHGEMRSAVSHAALVETVVCGKCERKLDVTKRGRAANAQPWTHAKDDLAHAQKVVANRAAAKKPAPKSTPKPAPAPHARTLRCVRCKGEFQHVPNPNGGRMPWYCEGCRDPKPPVAPKPVIEVALPAPKEIPCSEGSGVGSRTPTVTSSGPARVSSRSAADAASSGSGGRPKRVSGRLTFHAQAEFDDPLLNVSVRVDLDVFATPRERFEAITAGIQQISAAVRGWAP